MDTYPIAFKIIQACWMIFLVVWALAALFTKRSVYREALAQRLGYSLLLLAGCYLVFRGQRFHNPLSQRVIPANEIVIWIGVLLCVMGLGFCIWARLTLGRNWSGTVTLKEGHELIQRGPYRIVRHPIYTGLLAMIVATAIVMGHSVGVLGVLLALVSLWIKLSYEEKVMLQQFPVEYRDYQRRVKRLIPFVL